MIYYWLLLVIRCDGLHTAASTGGQQLSVVLFDSKSSFCSGKAIPTGDQLQWWAVCYIGDPVRFLLIIAGVCILSCQVFIPVPHYLLSLDWAEWLTYDRPVVCPADWQVMVPENNLLILIWNTNHTTPEISCSFRNSRCVYIFIVSSKEGLNWFNIWLSFNLFNIYACNF